MYNKCLEYLLDNNPHKTISKGGIAVRKALSPLVRLSIPLTTRTKFVTVRRGKLPSSPVIFAASHGFKEDGVDSLLLAGRMAYVLMGNITHILNTVEGLSGWVAGMVLVDRLNKESRAAAKEKMKLALTYGADVLMFPEGTWNQSPNQLVSGLFPGVYDVAKETGALVVPIATQREGKFVYGIRDEAFDISQYDRQEGIAVLRDKLATLRFELMEKYSRYRRSDLPYGRAAQAYWKQYLEDLIAEVEFYDYEVEKHSRYRPKGVTDPEEAFLFMRNLRTGRGDTRDIG